MSVNEEVNESIRPLLKFSREHIVRSQRLEYALVSSLERDPLLFDQICSAPGMDGHVAVVAAAAGRRMNPTNSSVGLTSLI
jgi:hypothetical protein